MIHGYPKWMSAWVCTDEWMEMMYPGGQQSTSAQCQWCLWEEE